jgi:hypothetical protein
MERWLPILTVVAGGIWTVYAYIDSQKDLAAASVKTRKFEAELPFLKKQLDTYYELVDVSGTLTLTKEDSAAFNEKFNRFWILYWMTLATAGDNKRVKELVEKFGTHLVDYKEYRLTDVEVLRDDVDALSRAVGDVLRDGWEETK